MKGEKISHDYIKGEVPRKITPECLKKASSTECGIFSKGSSYVLHTEETKQSQL